MSDEQQISNRDSTVHEQGGSLMAGLEANYSVVNPSKGSISPADRPDVNLRFEARDVMNSRIYEVDVYKNNERIHKYPPLSSDSLPQVFGDATAAHLVAEDRRVSAATEISSKASAASAATESNVITSQDRIAPAERPKELAHGPLVGVTQIDGKAATAIRYERVELEGQTGYNVTFIMDKKTVSKLKGMDYDALEDAVGPDNAGAIRDADSKKGTLKGSALTNEFGLSPDEKARRSEQSPTPAVSTLDPEAVAMVARARASDRQAVEESLGINTIEVERFRQRERNDEALNHAAGVRARDSRLASEETKLSVTAQGTSENQVISDDIFRVGETTTVKLIPSDIENKYLRVGDKFFHPKNTNAAVFEDKGNKLETRSNSETVADELVRIAEARGWGDLKVSGSETFRREVWVEAAARGMQVNGYNPSEADLAELAKRVKEAGVNSITTHEQPQRSQEQKDSKSNSGTAVLPTTSSERELPSVRMADSSNDAADILVAHGGAKYLNDKSNKMSYFVTTQNASGTEKTVWGVDLERAVAESGASVGDKVIVENIGQREVTVKVDLKDPESGKVIGSEDKKVNRNEWSVKLAEAFRDGQPEEVVKKHPELAGAYTAMAAMEKQVDSENFSAEHRDVVVRRIRQNMVNSIERGDVPKVNIRESVVNDNERQAERELAR